MFKPFISDASFPMESGVIFFILLTTFWTFAKSVNHVLNVVLYKTNCGN